jgi:hypothetical protein
MAEKDEWHLKKEVSVGHIISTVTFLIGMIAWGVNVEKTQSVHTSDIRNLEQRMNRSDGQVADALKEIKTALNRIEDRLNRK